MRSRRQPDSPGRYLAQGFAQPDRDIDSLTDDQLSWLSVDMGIKCSGDRRRAASCLLVTCEPCAENKLILSGIQVQPAIECQRLRLDDA